MSILLVTDGGSKGNPGRGGCAWVIGNGRGSRSGVVLFEECTNNQAEYMGLLFGLVDLLGSSNSVEDIRHISDSRVLVNVMTGGWRSKNSVLSRIVKSIRSMSKGIVMVHDALPREDFRVMQADSLYNLAIDGIGDRDLVKARFDSVPDALHEIDRGLIRQYFS